MDRVGRAFGLLKDDVTQEQMRVVDDLIAGSGLAASCSTCRRDPGGARFKQDFPDLAGAARPAREQSVSGVV